MRTRSFTTSLWLYKRRIINSVIRVLELILALTIMYQLWGLYILFTTTDNVIDKYMPPQIEPLPPAIAKVESEILTSFDPFYRSQLSKNESMLANQKADILLFGTRFSNKGKSSAILQLTGSQQKLFYEGDLIDSDIQLAKVHAEKIELLISSGVEMIFLDNTERSQADYLKPAIIIQESPLYSEANFLLQHEIVDALNDVTTLPNIKDQDIMGLEVIGGKDLQYLNRLGFKQGDILYGPDGSSLESHEKLLALTQNFTDTGNISLLVYRPAENLKFTLVIG